LRRQHRPHQRTRSGDGREVVSEQDPFIGGLEIVPVTEAFSRGCALIVERHHSRRDEFGVEAIAKSIRADGRKNKPDAVDMLAAVEGNPAQKVSRGERHD